MSVKIPKFKRNIVSDSTFNMVSKPADNARAVIGNAPVYTRSKGKTSKAKEEQTTMKFYRRVPKLNKVHRYKKMTYNDVADLESQATKEKAEDDDNGK